MKERVVLQNQDYQNQNDLLQNTVFSDNSYTFKQSSKGFIISGTIGICQVISVLD